MVLIIILRWTKSFQKNDIQIKKINFVDDRIKNSNKKNKIQYFFHWFYHKINFKRKILIIRVSLFRFSFDFFSTLSFSFSRFFGFFRFFFFWFFSLTISLFIFLFLLFLFNQIRMVFFPLIQFQFILFSFLFISLV
jgi:hypothetical protein